MIVVLESGGFIYGYADNSGPKYFLDFDIVLVSFNYRYELFIIYSDIYSSQTVFFENVCFFLAELERLVREMKYKILVTLIAND